MLIVSTKYMFVHKLNNEVFICPAEMCRSFCWTVLSLG